MSQRQQIAAEHFDDASAYWNDIYEYADVLSVVHQERRAAIRNVVSGLRLPAGSRILDVGCGAGHTAIELAQMGYRVEAVDRSEKMVKNALDNARRAGVASRIRASQMDIHSLNQPAGCFNLVLSIGVLPWLDSLDAPLRSLSRVIAPGGYLITTIDHRWGLHRVLDIRSNPFVLGLKTAARRALEAAGLRQRAARARTHSIRQLDAALRRAGLGKVGGATLGFGPFTFWNQPLFSDGAGVSLHRRLQALADAGRPILKTGGGQYIVWGCKPK